MKIIIVNIDIDFQNQFYRLGKPKDIEIINGTIERKLFEEISFGNVDAYIFANNLPFIQKATDFIKKKYPYTPIIIHIVDKQKNIKNADIYMHASWEDSVMLNSLFNASMLNIEVYSRNFEKLQKLTAPISDKISFGPCEYDPVRRLLFKDGLQIKKMTAKEGGILEVLASNIGKVIKREIILEKVWYNVSYFNGRSMDVYITHLRKLFLNENIPFTITNISGVGLILE